MIREWAQPPLWVPLTIAAIGLTTTFGAAALAQWWASRREDVRWGRERDERERQWQREDSLRWLQDRQHAYARLIAALHDWDAELISALSTRMMDERLKERTELDTDETDRRARAVREALAMVQFMASEKVRSLTQNAVSLRNDFRVLRLTAENIDVTDLNTRFSAAGEDRRTARGHA